MDAIGLLDSGGEGLRVGLCSRGLVGFESLPAFLGLRSSSFAYVHPLNRNSFDLYIGWGRKPSGNKALDLAERTGNTSLLLEDGFLRSAFPASVTPAPPLSLAVDDIGMYYDVRSPSRLEHLIQQAAQSSQDHTAGAAIIETLRNRKLCKYNNFIPLPDTLAVELSGPRVLVVDQTMGDLSISCANASAKSFTSMLEAARDENPGAEIWIKTHPETAAGSRKGYLSNALERADTRIISEPYNPWDLFPLVSSVYVVSSQLGFDAVMSGSKVRCFGSPFYAGWGLTEDELKCQRRKTSRPSREQLAAAAYAKYCRYLDPYTRENSDFKSSAATLSAISSVASKAHDLGPFVSIFPWNRKTVRDMFQAYGPSHQFYRHPRRALSESPRPKSLTVWASRIRPDWKDAIAGSGANLFRLEDGFLRSVGLGTNFHQPMSLVLDRTGIHYHGSAPSDLENILNHHEFDEQLTQRAQRLIDKILISNVSKYNVGSPRADLDCPAGKRCILVPGQVEDDASVVHSGSPLKKSLDLLEAVRTENPDAFVVFKPHPDVLAGQRRGLASESAASAFADLIVEDASIASVIDHCDEVHTLSSLAGFEALLRGKAATCYGLPFYSGWGLTTDKILCERRKRTLTLPELVAGTLILYPDYLDPVSGLPCTPEIVLSRIVEQRCQNSPLPVLVQARRSWGKVRRYAGRISSR